MGYQKLMDIIKRKEQEQADIDARRAEEKDKIEQYTLEHAVQRRQYENSHKDEKFELFYKITSWLEDFKMTQGFQRTFKIHDGEIAIFRNGWGHREPIDGGRHCGSVVTLDNQGTLEYWANHKWYNQPHFSLKEENIDRISLEYLKKLHHAIVTARVYDTMADELKTKRT